MEIIFAQIALAVGFFGYIFKQQIVSFLFRIKELDVSDSVLMCEEVLSEDDIFEVIGTPSSDPVMDAAFSSFCDLVAERGLPWPLNSFEPEEQEAASEIEAVYNWWVIQRPVVETEIDRLYDVGEFDDSYQLIEELDERDDLMFARLVTVRYWVY